MNGDKSKTKAVLGTKSTQKNKINIFHFNIMAKA